MSIDDRLAELRIVIPETTAPVANYVTARRTGNLLYLSGHLGKRDGAVVTGTVGDDVDTDAAYDLARRFVHSAPAFTEQSAVVNGASDLLVAVFGPERGRHARSAIGVAQLPLGAAVELEAIFEVISAPA